MTEVHAVPIVPRYGIPFVIMRGGNLPEAWILSYYEETNEKDAWRPRFLRSTCRFRVNSLEVQSTITDCVKLRRSLARGIDSTI
jgi:hypothetical protein